MNKLNEISIKQHLAKMNIHPIKDYSYYGMYHCPYREDHNASFKIDYSKNVWHDFGTNEGSSIIIQNILPITHPKLIAWVQQRKIDLVLANRYCKEIHYRNKEKNYFSIGFRNDKGGRKATELIKSGHSTVYNRSAKFADFKDLNDYLCQKLMVKSEVKKKKMGLKR